MARAVLVVIAILMLAGAGITLSPLSSTNYVPGRTTPGDVPLYQAEVDRIRGGEGYYQAAAAELTARGYPTKSVFNWRTPLPMWLIGKMPSSALAVALLGAMSLAVLLLSFDALATEEETVGGDLATESGHKISWRPVACVLLLIGALLPTILGDLFVMPSLWAGVWMALSIGAYGIDRRWLGVACGLAAVCFRELALPYCVVCLGLAWHERRHKETIVWLLGLAVWAALFLLHCWYATRWIAPDARAHADGWIRFGGAGFVISTVQMNAFLVMLPQWITAVYLIAALVGIAGWNTPLGQRVGLSACLFLAAFAVVGHGFNQYWGMLIAPLLCFGVVRFPISIRELWTAAQLGQQPSDLRSQI